MIGKRFLSLMVGVALATAACAAPPVTPSAAPGPAEPTTAAADAGLTSVATSTDPSPVDPCPVSVDTLAAALRSHGGELASVPDEMAMSEPECFAGYATVRVVGRGDQPARILFGYRPGEGWRWLNVGSAGYCAGYVPPAIAVHFTGCAG